MMAPSVSSPSAPMMLPLHLASVPAVTFDQTLSAPPSALIAISEKEGCIGLSRSSPNCIIAVSLAETSMPVSPAKSRSTLSASSFAATGPMTAGRI